MGRLRWGGALVALALAATTLTSVPAGAEAAPTVTVTPDHDLVDGQTVTVTVADLPYPADLYINMCTADRRRCMASSTNPFVDPGTVHVPFVVARSLAGVDCAVTACVVHVFGSGPSTDHFDASVPIAFDPHVPPPPPPTVTVAPAHALWDHQQVQLRVDGLHPNDYLDVSLCTSRHESSNCDYGIGYGQADDQGRFRQSVSVPRHPQLGTTAVDCAVVQCYIVVTGAAETAVPIDFDRGAPTTGFYYPSQAPCVAWPTHGWPHGPIPAGVDAAAVANVGEHMGNDSVVVIHGGKLVYEHYADGRGPQSIEPSFSVSKSFTSTIIGELVQQGKLSLDARAPIDEWSSPSDPRHVITLRNILNMSSGLQWDETYFTPDSDVDKLPFQPNAAAYVIAKPLAFTPGSQFRYSTGDTQVLGEIIRRTAHVSGPTYRQYLHDHLFDALGINPVTPLFDPSGGWLAGIMTATTTRNFAKLGLLYLRGGEWEGQQFLARSWTDFVQTPSPADSGYGGQFWLHGDGTYSMIGLLGQEVLIDPAHDLIVAVNNGGSARQMAQLFANAAPERCGAAGLVARADAATTSGGTATISVLHNDSGGTVGLSRGSLTVATLPGHGRATVVSGRIRYVAAGGYSGPDSFSYVVCNRDRSQCAEASVAVTVR